MGWADVHTTRHPPAEHPEGRAALTTPSATRNLSGPKTMSGPHGHLSCNPSALGMNGWGTQLQQQALAS